MPTTRSFLKGTGIFAAGTVTGGLLFVGAARSIHLSVISKLPPELRDEARNSTQTPGFSSLTKDHPEEAREDSHAFLREEIDRLQALGDSESWDRAQDLKMQINRDRNSVREVAASEKGWDSKIGVPRGATVSLGGGVRFLSPADKQRKKEVEALLDEARLGLASELEARGDEESREKARLVRRKVEIDRIYRVLLRNK